MKHFLLSALILANAMANSQTATSGQLGTTKRSECDFPNKVKPWRVGNACKAVLDDVPKLGKKCCGMKTPSGAYKFITDAVSDRFSACSYFESTVAIAPSSAFIVLIFFCALRHKSKSFRATNSLLVVPTNIDQGSPDVAWKPNVNP